MTIETPDSTLRRGARAAATTLSVAILVACTGHVSQQEDAQIKRQDTVGASQPAEDQIDKVVVTGSRIEQIQLESAAPVATTNSNDADVRHRAAPMAERKVAYPMAQIAHFGTATPPEMDRERYAILEDQGIKLTADSPVSTFSVDVDTGAYSNVRRFLNDGQLPPSDAVRIEELVNYFSYQYDLPKTADQPFAVNTQVAPTPWNPDTLLMQIGIKGFEVPASERPASNLVFLIDVSGSMHSANKLPLLKDAFSMLTNNLNDHDRVSLVVYAGASGVVLPPTAGDDKGRIDEALGRLRAGGSTNGESGIRLAYDTARSAFIEGGINRVILATDGDFNVGIANVEKLIDVIERERETGVSLTTLGFGSGNYNDELMERIADAGNGNYAYIDSLNEARKVLVDEMGGTLHTIAKDVKIQVEFNPTQVAEYRLIGYQNRVLNREDFNNDKIDAGEIGAGHTVTALYELTPVDSAARRIDPLRYDEQPRAASSASDELAFVKLRFKAPDGDTSRLLKMPVQKARILEPNQTDEDFRFAAAVAAFGQQLRGGLHLGDYSLDETLALAGAALGEDRHGYRQEFLGLVTRTQSLTQGNPDALSQAITR